MYSVKNNGQLIGTILPESKGSTSPIHEFKFNGDGSQRIAMTIACSDNFQSKFSESEVNAMSEQVRAARRITKGSDGQYRGYKTQTISLEQFLPAGDNGVRLRNRYKNMKPGDLVCATYSLRSSSWVDANGETQYKQWSEIEDVTVLKKVTTKAAAPAAAEPAAEGVTNENEPF